MKVVNGKGSEMIKYGPYLLSILFLKSVRENLYNIYIGNWLLL